MANNINSGLKSISCSNESIASLEKWSIEILKKESGEYFLHFEAGTGGLINRSVTQQLIIAENHRDFDFEVEIFHSVLRRLQEQFPPTGQ